MICIHKNKAKTSILFVCLGNICRSPMAEFLFRDLLVRHGLNEHFYVASAATSREELGNPVHPGTRKKLAETGISCAGKRASQLSPADYQRYDWLLGMDSGNIRDMLRILGGDSEGKVRRLLDFSAHPRDIADPWFTGNFDVTYADIQEGCMALLNFLLAEETVR